MKITRERCSFCGVERWSVAAMFPCDTLTTFHSWTVEKAAIDAAIHEVVEEGRRPAKQGEMPANLDVLLIAFGFSPEQFSRALQIQWAAK